MSSTFRVDFVDNGWVLSWNRPLSDVYDPAAGVAGVWGGCTLSKRPETSGTEVFTDAEALKTRIAEFLK